MDALPQSAKPLVRFKATSWLKAILLGFCGGLLFLVVDLVLRGQ